MAKDFAVPHSAVMTLHRKTPPATMPTRRERSASQPTGSPSVALKNANAIPSSRLISVSVRCRSRLMGSIRRLSTMRSMKEKTKQTSRTTTTYQP